MHFGVSCFLVIRTFLMRALLSTFMIIDLTVDIPHFDTNEWHLSRYCAVPRISISEFIEKSRKEAHLTLYNFAWRAHISSPDDAYETLVRRRKEHKDDVAWPSAIFRPDPELTLFIPADIDDLRAPLNQILTERGVQLGSMSFLRVNSRCNLALGEEYAQNPRLAELKSRLSQIPNAKICSQDYFLR